MSKVNNKALEQFCDYLEAKFQENLERGYRGLGVFYSGLWSLAKEVLQVKDGKELMEVINQELSKRGYKLVPDKRAKIKMVKISKSESVKKELLEDYQNFLRMRSRRK